MSENRFELLLQAAEQLNWQDEAEEIRELQQTAEEKNFFVAFVGCYSAGKSCLLNNVLGRELLPHGTTETTTVLTYIRYAEEEKAMLHKVDGSVQEITLDEVGDIDQRKEKWSADELAYLEVYINSELLKGGMILMDTPGINTVIDRHEQLLRKSLAVAAQVIYVTSGAPRQVDLKVLQEMQRRGIKPACVRTHFDAVNQQEEDPQQTMDTDRTLLGEYGIAPESCYFVSNLKESVYYEALEPLKDLLMERGAHAQDELEQAIGMRLQTLAGRCEKELEQQLEVLQQLEQQDRSAVQKKCDALREQIEALERSVESREDEIQSRLNQARQKLEGTVTRRMEDELSDSANRIARSMAAQKDTVTLMRTEARRQLELLNQNISEIGSDALRQTNTALQTTFQSLQLETAPELVTDDFVELQMDQDDRLEEVKQALDALRQNREKNEQELENMDGSQIEQEMQEAEEEQNRARNDLNAQGEYVPKMVRKESDSPQPSEIAGKIGQLADLALFFGSGDIAIKGISKLTTSPKTTRMIASRLRKADRQKDTLYLFKKLSDIATQKKRMKQATAIADTAGAVLTAGVKGANVVHDIKEREGYTDDEVQPDIFDLVTVEYWAKKVGAKFDKPPQYVEDKKTADEWKAMRATLEDELRDKQMRAYEKKKAYNIFKSREEQLKAEQEAMKVQEDELEREWEQRSSQLKAAAAKNALKKWHKECAEWYLEQVRPELQAVIAQAREDLPNRIMMYQTEQLENVRNRLQLKNDEYEALLNSSSGETKEKLEATAKLLNGLKEQYGDV